MNQKYKTEIDVMVRAYLGDCGPQANHIYNFVQAVLAKWGTPAEWLEQAYREGWAACRDAETIGEESEDWSFGNSTANSRMIDAQQAVHQPAPTADSQPAIQGETNVQLDTDSNHSAPGQQWDMACSLALGQRLGNRPNQEGSNTDSQAQQLLTVAKRNLHRFLETTVFRDEADRQAALNCLEVLTQIPQPADCGNTPYDEGPFTLSTPANAITASIVQDGGGDKPAFCLMVAYRTEAEARHAMNTLAMPIPANLTAHKQDGLQALHDLLYMAQRSSGEARDKAINDARLVLYRVRESIQTALSAAQADSVLEDAARWQALPAFFEEYQIDAMKLYHDIDAYLDAARKQGEPHDYQPKII